jgi:MFS family permease
MAPSTIGTGLLVGLVVTGCGVVTLGAASSLFNWVAYGVRFGLVYGLILGFVSVVASILTGMLKSGWSSQIVAEDQLEEPNEGTHRSLKNALFAACLFGPLGGIASGLACGLAFGAVGQLAGWPILALGFTLVLGIVFALDFLLLQGGIAYVQHYVLRWYLWRAGSLPWRYAAFLNYAVERMLLKKRWGGYTFTHLLLLEYLASLDLPATSEKQHSARHAPAHGDGRTTPDWSLAISASLASESEHAAHE